MTRGPWATAPPAGDVPALRRPDSARHLDHPPSGRPLDPCAALPGGHHSHDRSQTMTSHDDHGDANLDVIGLLESSVRDDHDGFDAMLAGALDSPHLPHIVGTLVGILGHELISHHGIDDTLAMLDEQRRHALRFEAHINAEECDHPPVDDADDDGQDEDDMCAPADLDDVVYSLDKQTEQLDALVRAVVGGCARCLADDHTHCQRFFPHGIRMLFCRCWCRATPNPGASQ